MRRYIFTLQSDQGKVKYITISISLTDAINTCLKSQDAPEIAITKIKVEKLY